MNIEEKLEEVTMLFKQLKMAQENNIMEHGFQIEEELVNSENIENEEHILDYSSDEEPAIPIQVKNEAGTSKDNQSQFKWETGFDNYAFKKGFINKDSKYTKIPSKYVPKIQEMEGERMLDLDCKKNEKEIFENWLNSFLLEAFTNPKLSELSGRDIWNYIGFHTKGTIRDYMTSIENQIIEELATKTTAYDKILYIMMILYKEFFGKNIIDHRQEVYNKEYQEAKNHLANIQIYDLCNVESYICEYRIHYYKLKEEDKNHYLSMYITKLPYPANEFIMGRFIREINRGTIENNFGGATSAIREEIKERCMQEATQKRFANIIRICCQDNEEIPQKYGLNKNFQRKRKYQFRKRKYYPNWRKKRYFRKENNNKNKRQRNNYCPNKKENCKCWYCQEEGHYANECPKKKDKKDLTKQIEIAKSCFMEPLEESDDNLDYIFEYVSETDSETE